MEFVDNTGHIFSLPSYDEKPIGYEYDEYSYVFWIDANTSRLSVNNYYSKPIYALYQLESDDIDNIDIEVYCHQSNVFQLISSIKLYDYITSGEYKNLNDYINLNDLSEGSTYIKSKLTNDDLLVYKTSELIERGEGESYRTSNMNYLLIPIYPIAMSNEEGTWITNIMIHITDNSVNKEEWCYISVGAEFINEYEELVINGKNMGVNLPKDILKAVYSESIYNDVFNESLYNEKLKEYMINYMGIRGERGNFGSAIKSLKWFGYGDKLTISKLLKTDNEFKCQYINDYFDISNDVIYAYKNFVSDSLISLRIMLNRETDELYPFDVKEKSFYGENKPKMLSLIDYYEKVKIGNHDMPIEEDDEKYWYYKPYFDFSLTELGIKLMCLSTFYKKYFLPLHLHIHSATLGYKVFMNDIKLTSTIGYNITHPLVMINNHKQEVEFPGDGVHYFTQQYHYIDDNFNEFKLDNIASDSRTWYELNDTCVNIPIRFLYDGYYNCVLLLYKKNTAEVLYESHFSFIESNEYRYKNFIIYPKKLNVLIDRKLNEYGDEDINISSRYFDYWINNEYSIKLLVNNKWYEYDFKLKINNPILDFGTLRYRYYLNEHNYLISRINKNDAKYHSLLFIDPEDIKYIYETDVLSSDLSDIDINTLNDSLYTYLRLNSDKSFIKTINMNEYNLYQYLESNYNILSPFKQINNIANGKISFNAYMHNTQLVNVNNIDYDIDFYKILKYHLDKNLLYIDGTLVDNEFYQYIIYERNGNQYEIVIHKDLVGGDIEIPEENLYKYSKILICAYEDILYILTEASDSDDSYYIRNIYDNNNTIITAEFEDENDKPIALIYDSVNLKYNKVTNSYYEVTDNNDIIDYPLYDKLYSNSEKIYSKYLASTSLPNLSKYKNSIHLFNLYTEKTTEINILKFNNDIDIYINGLRISNRSDNSTYNPKFTISDNGNIADTRYIDIYGLHWISNPEINIVGNNVVRLKDVPLQLVDTLNQYGIYVKRNYDLYYDGIVENIYDLSDIDEYATSEFSLYFENENINLGYAKYKTLNDFYENKSYNSDVDVYIKDGIYYWEDDETRNLNNMDEFYQNKLRYSIEFRDKNNNKMDVSLNDISNVEYDHIHIKFFYHKPHIVRNRFYLLSEFLELNNDKKINVNLDTNTLTINNDDSITTAPIVKINDKYTYIDTKFNHIILNQNPSMYWYNVDNNHIDSLPEYLNELERFTYNNENETFEDIIRGLDEYKHIFYNQIYNDQNTARYQYNNYLAKDLTGINGEYKLVVEQNSNSYDIRLCVEIIKDNNVYSYNSIDNPMFVLDGTEDKVTLYIQFNKQFESSNELWFIPKLIKYVKEDVLLEYDPKESGNEIKVNFLNKEYSYGDNSSEYVYNLYNTFFKLNFNIYDNYIDENNTMHNTLLNSVYDVRDELKLNEYLDYDFYLMHDDKYWYCLYISQQTVDKIKKQSDLTVSKENQELSFTEGDIKYKLKYVRSSEEYLINRLEFVSSNGYNHFKDDDIICCYVYNNERLPFSPYISSKWNIKAMSIGSKNDSQFDSNAEMTILSIPSSMNKYEKGYYKVDVKYSLDRDVQHQFKNTSTILIS